MTDYTNVPESLHEWAQLNDRYDQLTEVADGETVDPAVTAEMRVLNAKIKYSWQHAPMLDRARMNWRLIKQAWRERSIQAETEEKKP